MIDVGGLGEILDLAKALGIVTASNSLNSDWFARPDHYVKRILRDAGQRAALLRSLEGLLGASAASADGRTWIPVVREGGLAVHLVLSVRPTGVELGIGAALTTTGPDTTTRALVPLLFVPTSADVQVALGTAQGRVHVDTDLRFGPAPASPGSASLGGLRAAIEVPTDGSAGPAIALVLRQLRLPGQSEARDVALDFAGTHPAQDALRMLTGFLQQAAAGQSGEAAEILALLGLSADPRVPALPVAALLEQGPAALPAWLEAVFTEPSALSAWLGHLAAIIRRGSTVSAPAAPGDPVRLSWALPSGVSLGVAVRVTRPSTGSITVDVGLDARWAGGAGRVELDLALIRFTLGPAPSLLGLPLVSIAARLVGSGTSPLVSLPAPEVVVQSLRVGFAIDHQRKPAFVLGAHGVRLLGHDYPFLDLTNPQTAIDVGNNAVASLASQILGRLGPAGDAVQALLGLGPPVGIAPADWPVPPIGFVDFLRDPVSTISGYHRTLLTGHRDRYDELLLVLRGLLAVGGPAGPVVLGQGTAALPWRVRLTAAGPGPALAIVVWTSGATAASTTPDRLHLGLRLEAEVDDLGGGCPRVELDVRAELVRIGLVGPSAAFPSVSAAVGLGARGRVPIELGDGLARVEVDRLGVRFGFADGRFGAELEAPNLRLHIEDQSRLIDLPRIDAGGAFVGVVPWDALELLAGHILARTRLPALERLADVLGWRSPRATLRLSLSQLAVDPLPELLRWLGAIVGRESASWLSMLIGGPVADGANTGLLLGRGDASSPFEIPLAARRVLADGRTARLLVWPGELPEVDDATFRPGALMTALMVPSAGLGAETLAASLVHAILGSRELGDVLDGRTELTSGIAGLLVLMGDGDGRVPASAATRAGATAHDVRCTHAELPAALDLTAVTGRALDRATLFVSLDATWAGLAPDRLIALDAAGLAPEAFDVARAAAEDGPWLVRLPRRAAATSAPGQDPIEQQALRLERVVAAVRGRTGGGIRIVAHGGAGHAALRAASRSAGVTHLVSLGTPYTRVDHALLESAPMAGALELLDALLPPVDASREELPVVVLGRALVTSLVELVRGDLAGELVPPASPPAIPGTLAVHCVRGRIPGPEVLQAMAGVVARGLQAAAETRGAAAAPTLPTRIGLGVHNVPAAAAGELRVSTEARLILFELGSTTVEPVLRARMTIERVGGWLAGGPGRPPGSARTPSVRRATLELEVPLVAASGARARVVLHEAEALGVRRQRWVVDGGALEAEARILIGRVMSAMGPLPATGPVRDALLALWALGLTEPVTPAPGWSTTIPAPGAVIGLSVEALQRMLMDPSGALASLRASASGPAALARALAALLGAPAPTGSAVVLTVDGISLSADLEARRLTVSAAGLALDAGLAITGELTVDAAGPRGRIGLAVGGAASPSGRPVLEVESSPLRASLRLEGGALPERIPLFPTPDEAGLRRVLAAVVPAQILWAGVTFLRTLAAGAVNLVDPVLSLFGLIEGTGATARVRVPAGLLADPGRYLLHSATLGASDGAIDASKLIAAVDAVAAMIGLPAAAGGGWQLPYGAVIGARTTATGHARIGLAFDQPIASTGLRIGGGVGLVLPRPGESVAPDVTLMLALPGAASVAMSSRLEANVAASGFSLKLVFPSAIPPASTELRLVPHGPGLNELGSALANAAITYALPYALDAIAGLPPSHAARTVGQAVAALGDALGLRTAGRFAGAQIQQLAAHPETEIAARLSANLGASFSALAALVQPALPIGIAVTASGSELVVERTGVLVIRLSVPTLASVRVSATLSPLAVVQSARLSGELVVDATGLRRARVTFDTPVANPLVIGPLALSPFAEVDLGLDVPGGSRASVGLSVDATHRLLGVFRFEPSFAFTMEPATPAQLVETIVLLLVPIAADVALSTGEVRGLIARPMLGTTLRALLTDVILRPGAGDSRFDPLFLQPSVMWRRLLVLAGKIAQAASPLLMSPLSLAITSRTAGANTFYGVGLSLAPGGRFPIASGDVTLVLEVDASWIRDASGTALSGEGIVVELLQVPTTGDPQPFFSLTIAGVGLRLGRSSGPLLDTFIVTDSIALHGFFAVDTSGVRGGGGQIELGGLKVALSGASGGNNSVAQGVLRDSGTGAQRPAPALSPALALQKHGSGALQFDLRAGPGDGPWWITIQRGFGPVYIEQVGFGVTKEGQQVVAASVMIDGRVSLLGLTVSVDDLALGFRWPREGASPADPPLYDPRAWDVSLQGLGVSADTGGVTLSGGLSKAPGPVPDYVGTVTIRFSVYGITAFGGYAVVGTPPDQYTSLFLFGALNAPIGGPPMFFVTGIGAGVGVNRLLRMPTMETLPAHPLVRALDRNSQVAQSPDQALAALREYFPSERGSFWFAAGISFTSFTLVEAVAVLGVAIGDGLEINLLGLARAGLPNPSAAIVQIELALLARFSTREGVLWIQAQLTDNSWLLTRDCRLTGGFAFVTWFKGVHAGEFVVTIGGYHPSFHREGYPVVPRLGFIWTISSALVIKGESYFALTSEAIMAGARFEARLELGPLWAYLRLGADGIVYFDPFSFEVSAFAELGAGITIDIDLGWLGHIRITISLKLHANVLLMGPEFRGRATIDLGVATASIAFGDWDDNATPTMLGAAFVTKYLEPQGARILSANAGFGQVPRSPGVEGSRPEPATGAAGDPFLLLPEFSLSINSTGAISVIDAAGAVALPEPVILGIGPMARPSVTSRLVVSIRGADRTEYVDRVEVQPQMGKFPKAVWAVLPPVKKVPEGEMVTAASGVIILAAANPTVGSAEIDAHQIKAGPRHPLPFLGESEARLSRWSDVLGARDWVAEMPRDTLRILATAALWRESGAAAIPQPQHARVLTAASRRAPPRLVPLTYGMAAPPSPRVHVERIEREARVAPPHRAAPPLLVALLEAPPIAARSRTTVGAAGHGVRRTAPPSLTRVRGELRASLAAELTLVPPRARPTKDTVMPARLPFTGRAGSGRELRRSAGRATAVHREHRDSLSRGLGVWRAGQVAVLEVPDPARDRAITRPRLDLDGAARVVILDEAGGLLIDRVEKYGLELPPGSARIALLPGAGRDPTAGWHAASMLLQLHPRTLIGPSCVLHTAWKSERRGARELSAGFARAADRLLGDAEVTTTFALEARSIALLFDRGDGEASPDDLDLALEGAARAHVDGELVAPEVMVSGERLIVVYAIAPEGPVISVTVAASDKLRISGVLASTREAHELAADLEVHGAGALCGALVHDPRAVTSMRWSPPCDDDEPKQPNTQRAR